MTWYRGCGCVATVAALGAVLMGGPATAQDEPGIETPDSLSVSGAVGVEVASHFVLYGADVWGAGSSWSRPSVFAFNEVSFDFDLFDVTTGVWGELRESDTGPLGGPISEIDWYIGTGFDIDRLRVDLVYQAWMYPIDDEGQTEHVFDVVLGFDDSDLIFEGFALNPAVVAHTRLSGGGAESGTVFVFGVEPEHTFLAESDYPITLSVPGEVAFGVDDFYEENGFGYAALGLSAGVPLAFVPADYGEWGLGANLTYYWTDDEAIGNPQSDFLTGLVGVYLDF